MNAIKFGTLIAFIAGCPKEDMSQSDVVEIASLVEACTAPPPYVPAADSLSQKEVLRNINDMFQFMITSRKIEAIKAYRVLTGQGLKESKDAIESIMHRFTEYDNRPKY